MSFATSRISGVPIYASSANLPTSSIQGSLAVTADTGDLYEFNGTSWVLLAAPGGAVTPGGAEGAVQYNSAGTFGGFGDWNGTVLTVPSIANAGNWYINADGSFALSAGNFFADASGNAQINSLASNTTDAFALNNNGSMSVSFGQFVVDASGLLTTANGASFGSGIILLNDDGSASFADGGFTIDSSGNTGVNGVLDTEELRIFSTVSLSNTSGNLTVGATGAIELQPNGNGSGGYVSIPYESFLAFDGVVSGSTYNIGIQENQLAISAPTSILLLAPTYTNYNTLDDGGGNAAFVGSVSFDNGQISSDGLGDLTVTELRLNSGVILDSTGIESADFTERNLYGTNGSANYFSWDNGIGFFAATPVAQQTASGVTSGFTANTSTNFVYVESTFDGATGPTMYTIGDIVAALKNYGLLAQ